MILRLWFEFSRKNFDKVKSGRINMLRSYFHPLCFWFVSFYKNDCAFKTHFNENCAQPAAMPPMTIQWINTDTKYSRRFLSHDKNNRLISVIRIFGRMMKLTSIPLNKYLLGWQIFECYLIEICKNDEKLAKAIANLPWSHVNAMNFSLYKKWCHFSVLTLKLNSLQANKQNEEDEQNSQNDLKNNVKQCRWILQRKRTFFQPNANNLDLLWHMYKYI